MALSLIALVPMLREAPPVEPVEAVLGAEPHEPFGILLERQNRVLGKPVVQRQPLEPHRPRRRMGDRGRADHQQPEKGSRAASE